MFNTFHDNKSLNQNNRDKFNTVFLSNYDLFKNTEFINGEIRKLIDDIGNNRNKYKIYFKDNIKQINSDIDKFNEDFKGVFNYRYLTNDFYKMIMDKMNKYSEKISQMKKYIYDTVNKDGSFEKIIDDKNNLETKIKQRFPNNIPSSGINQINQINQINFNININKSFPKFYSNNKDKYITLSNGQKQLNKDLIIFYIINKMTKMGVIVLFRLSQKTLIQIVIN